MRGADCNTRQFVVESVEQRFGYLGRLGGSDNVDREAFDRKYTRRLNPQQTEAVHAVDGAVLLLAVPGSGKTTVLVTRLGYMLCCCGIAPDQILTMTYTRAATREMKQRFSRLFGDDCPQIPQFRTINGVSSKIISFYTQDHGKGQAFPLIEDEGALARLVSDLYRELSGEYATQSVTKGLRRCIAYAKNMMLNQEEISQLDTGFEKFPELYSRYNQALRRQRWMDYDDQMVYAKTILERYPDVLAHFQEAFPYICVDESQDTSRIQHAIINLLARKSGNIFLVGDEDQSIYGFRAAYPDALMQFERTYPGARVLLMEENYRSTPEILRTADAFIRRNHDRRPKTIRPTRASGAGVHLVRAADRAAQYAWLILAAAHSDGQIAVLYRNNDSVLPLIDLLDRHGIPYRCRQTDDTFFTHRIVTDILDIIAFAHDGQNAEVFLRIYYKLGGGISKKEAEFACEKSAASGKPILQELLRFPQLPTFVRDSVTGLISLLPRLLIAFFNTDEIFALAMAREAPLTVPFLLGLGTLPFIGWTLGTLCGALAGSILPLSIRTALGVMLYGMFVAIVVPPAKKNRDVFVAVVLALIFSSLFSWTPGLKTVSPGLSIVVCTVAAAAICAALFPVKEEREAA